MNSKVYLIVFLVLGILLFGCIQQGEEQKKKVQELTELMKERYENASENMNITENLTPSEMGLPETPSEGEEVKENGSGIEGNSEEEVEGESEEEMEELPEEYMLIEIEGKGKKLFGKWEIRECSAKIVPRTDGLSDENTMVASAVEIKNNKRLASIKFDYYQEAYLKRVPEPLKEGEYTCDAEEKERIASSYSPYCGVFYEEEGFGDFYPLPGGKLKITEFSTHRMDYISGEWEGKIKERKTGEEYKVTTKFRCNLE